MKLIGVLGTYVSGSLYILGSVLGAFCPKYDAAVIDEVVSEMMNAVFFYRIVSIDNCTKNVFFIAFFIVSILLVIIGDIIELNVMLEEKRSPD